MVPRYVKDIETGEAGAQEVEWVVRHTAPAACMPKCPWARCCTVARVNFRAPHEQIAIFAHEHLPLVY